MEEIALSEQVSPSFSLVLFTCGKQSVSCHIMHQ